MPLQLPLCHRPFSVADDWDWDSGLHSSFVQQDHREPYVDGLERAMVLTCK